MNSEMIELAREVVACDGWRWMEGMTDQWGNRIFHVDEELYPIYYDGDQQLLEPDALPDLSDPATLGCLNKLACEVNDVDVIRFYKTGGSIDIDQFFWSWSGHKWCDGHSGRHYFQPTSVSGRFSVSRKAIHDLVVAQAYVAALESGCRR